MRSERKRAETEYKRALSALRAAEDGTDISAYEAANDTLAMARAKFIAAEIAYPTITELKRADRRRWLREIGMDA